MRDQEAQGPGEGGAQFKQLTVRVDPALRKAVRLRALELDCSSQEFVVAALEAVLRAGFDPRA